MDAVQKKFNRVKLNPNHHYKCEGQHVKDRSNVQQRTHSVIVVVKQATIKRYANRNREKTSGPRGTNKANKLTNLQR